MPKADFGWGLLWFQMFSNIFEILMNQRFDILVSLHAGVIM